MPTTSAGIASAWWPLLRYGVASNVWMAGLFHALINVGLFPILVEAESDPRERATFTGVCLVAATVLVEVKRRVDDGRQAQSPAHGKYPELRFCRYFCHCPPVVFGQAFERREAS
jgi:hypothetical protein